MTSAEKALLDAACEHWISGRFNHLILAVIAERKAEADACDLCMHCNRLFSNHEADDPHRCLNTPHDLIYYGGNSQFRTTTFYPARLVPKAN